MLSQLREWFWQERLWFPEGLGWADLEDRDGRVYAKAGDLWVALPIALIFLIIRQIFERLVHFSLRLTGYPCLYPNILLSLNFQILLYPLVLSSWLLLLFFICPLVISSSDL